MLLRPVVIDLTRPHRLERALHAQRADIDVAKDQGDEQHRDDAVTFVDLQRPVARELGGQRLLDLMSCWRLGRSNGLTENEPQIDHRNPVNRREQTRSIAMKNADAY
jgi:hypothetical protein